MRVRCWLGASVLALALGCSHARSPAPRVVLVQPSGPTIPANLLRLSIRFQSPIDGPVIGRLGLLREDGSRIDEPFLEQELWSADARVLTVLMHPGRVKSGLKVHEERGPILAAGEEVTLVLDGYALKRWRTGAADEIGPVPLAWTLSAVRVGSKRPLVVSLDAIIDGRDAEYLAIADSRGRRVAGQARLIRGESAWTFTPSAPWKAGAYKLVARGTLEDPSGNRLGSRFQTPVDAPPGPPLDVMIPFAAAPGHAGGPP